MKKAAALVSCIALGGSVAVGALVACDVGTATDEAVITSVTVRAADVTRGLGCGERDGQVYKYVVVAKANTSSGRVVVGTKLADCFADATFVDPPIVRDVTYTLDVFLFDRAGFAATANPFAPESPGAFGKLTCSVTALFQVQAFSSCGEASALDVPPRADASASDAGPDATTDASSDATTDASSDAASDASDAASPDAGD